MHVQFENESNQIFLLYFWYILYDIYSIPYPLVVKSVWTVLIPFSIKFDFKVFDVCDTYVITSWYSFTSLTGKTRINEHIYRNICVSYVVLYRKHDLYVRKPKITNVDVCTALNLCTYMTKSKNLTIIIRALFMRFR